MIRRRNLSTVRRFREVARAGNPDDLRGRKSKPQPPIPGGSHETRSPRSKLGQPYEYGGESDGGWDCSGLVQWAFGQVGVQLPRTSFSQFGVGTPVDRASIQAGDLVFFNAAGPGASHVAIATSNSSAISATTHGVVEHPIGGSYWGAHYVGARRM